MKKHAPSNKILIVLPFWEQDRAASIGLSHLLADIQPAHSHDIDILFVARFDCPQVDSATVKHVSRKFNAMLHTSKRRETGWPAGCNGTHFGALEFIYHKANTGGIPGYKAIFFCEADTVPLSVDCFAYLHREWERINRSKPVVVAGALVPDGGKEHVNGGACLLSGSLAFLRWLVIEVGGMKARVGWDFGLARDFRARGWANIPGIRSFWNTPTMSRAEAEDHARRGVVWLHGVKDGALCSHARSMLT